MNRIRKSRWVFTVVSLLLTSGLMAESSAEVKSRRQEELASHASRLEAGLARLSYLEGDWRVEVLGVGPGGELVPIDDVELEFTWIQNRKALASTVSLANYTYLIHVTYDVNLDRYRVSSLDDVSGLLDVYEGTFEDSGTLNVSNPSTGIYYRLLGKNWHTRMRLVPKEDGFDWLIDVSDDEGASWQPNTIGRVRSRR